MTSHLPTPTLVLDQHGFESEFPHILMSAEKFAFVESAYITIDGVKRFADAIAGTVARNVPVCVFVQRPRGWSRYPDGSLNNTERADLQKFATAVDYLESLGAHVSLRPGTHLKTAVIDGRWVWSGSLNILSYTMWTEEEMLFWDDPDWAKQTITRRRLRDCAGCRAALKDLVLAPSFAADISAIGKQIVELRKSSRLSQQDLADGLGMHRLAISRIENGKVIPPASVLFRIYKLLEYEWIAVPSEVGVTLRAWIAANFDSAP